MMPGKQIQLFLLLCITTVPVNAGDQLVLELDVVKDLLSLSHNIDNFLFAPTKNYQAGGEENINNMDSYPVLANNLSVTALVRLDDEVVGFATEQEIVSVDPNTQHPFADSIWVFRFSHPELQGFMTVLQREDAHQVFSLAQEVSENQEKAWEDKWYKFLSTDGEVRVQLASGDLAKYKGGKFEEYNYLNPSDLANYGYFRARITFVISPGVTE